MSDRTQTLSVELTREEVEKLMQRAAVHKAGCFSESPERPCDCGAAAILTKLRAALSQSEHQEEADETPQHVELDPAELRSGARNIRPEHQGDEDERAKALEGLPTDLAAALQEPGVFVSQEGWQGPLAVLLRALRHQKPLCFTGNVLVAFAHDMPDSDLWKASAEMVLDADDLAALDALVNQPPAPALSDELIGTFDQAADQLEQLASGVWGDGRSPLNGEEQERILGLRNGFRSTAEDLRNLASRGQGGENGIRDVAQEAVEALTAALFLLAPGEGYTPEDPRSMAALWNDQLLPVLAAARNAGLEANPYLKPIKANEYPQPLAGEVEGEQSKAVELLERFKGVPSVDPKTFREDVQGEVEGLLEGLTEFDAWLSFRPEFKEVLDAFRKAFGTDTSAPSDSQGEQGWVTCPMCGGTGEWAGTENLGPSPVRCGYCSGRGKVVCKRCGGDGIAAKNYPPFPPEMGRCPDCQPKQEPCYGAGCGRCRDCQPEQGGIESRNDGTDEQPATGRDRASTEHDPQRPSEPGTEGGLGAGANPSSPRSRAGDSASALASADPTSTQVEGEDREPNVDEWCCDSCGLIAPAESEGWEQTPMDDAGVTVEFCPAHRLFADQPEPGGEEENGRLRLALQGCEKLNERAEDRASKAEAERDREKVLREDAYRYQQAAEDLLNPEQKRAQRAENALEELAEEFERLATGRAGMDASRAC